MSGLGARQKRRVGLILCAKKRKKNALNIKLEIQISDIMYLLILAASDPPDDLWG
jgi:hypothetical protein